MNVIQQFHIRKLFDFLSKMIIIFVCVCIEHALRKYENEISIKKKFEKNVMHNKFIDELHSNEINVNNHMNNDEISNSKNLKTTIFEKNSFDATNFTKTH